MNKDLSIVINAISSNEKDCDLFFLREVLGKTFLKMENNPELFLDFMFLDGICNAMTPETEKKEHIYLSKYELPQIVLYDTLVNKFPFVTYSHALMNSALASTLCQSEHSVLIDIGMGRGLQVERLLRSMPRGSHLKKLTIIGIEPFGQALSHSQEALSEAAKSISFEVEFVPIEGFAEKVTFPQLKKKLPRHYDTLAVNAAFAIHHIRTANERAALFGILSQLEPHAFVLAEPDSNHMESDWVQRVHNSRVPGSHSGRRARPDVA